MKPTTAQHDLRTWSTKEASQETGIPVKTLYRLADQRAIRCLRIGRSIRFRPSDIVTFLRSCEQ